MPILVYRLARALWVARVPVLPKLLKVINRVVFSVVLPPSVRIGKDVRLGYQGLGIVIHGLAVIEARVAIGTGVTIGGRSGQPGAPVICEGAMIGSGAKVLGAVRVGKFASIGANAVVLSDVPDYAVAVGVPARVVRILKPEEVPDYLGF